MKTSGVAWMALFVLMTGCSRATPDAARPTDPGEQSALQAATRVPSSLPLIATLGSSETPLAALSTQSQPTGPTASPTTDLRLLPNYWRSWPVVPSISHRAHEIYAMGMERGNDPQAFSKVGDCQNTPEVFLGIYDRPGAYQFDTDYAFLQETVDYFAGSFARESIAVRGGFNLASVLSPLWADPTQCQSGETPLECELRLHRPSIVIISMETWFPGRTGRTYEEYLRQVVEYAISRGAVPILATKADNVEGDHSINRATAQVAYDYDVPLWNFWLAVQPLPQHGIDWTRDPQGFHITTEAWGVRSYTALEALHAVWVGLTTTE